MSRASVLWTAALLCTAGAGCKKRPPAMSLDEKRALFGDARNVVGDLDHKRREALARAPHELVPRPDLGPCPFVFHMVLPMETPESGPKRSTMMLDLALYDAARGDDLLGNIEDELLAIENVGIASRAEVLSKPGPLAFDLQATLRDLENTPPDQAGEKAQRLADPSRLGQDFELVIDDEILPQAKDDKTFQSGLIRASLYVWDNTKGSIVCAANVLATNSDELVVRAEPRMMSRETESSLRSDLRERALESAKDRLLLVG